MNRKEALEKAMRFVTRDPKSNPPLRERVSKFKRTLKERAKQERKLTRKKA